jgi:Tol biopolymer transport system component
LPSLNNEQLTVDALYHFDLAINKSGGLAFSSNRTGNYEIWTRKNGKDIAITNNNAFDARPTWSSDGQEIIFESSRSGKMNLWKKSINSDNASMITDEKTGARFPVWWFAKN